MASKDKLSDQCDSCNSYTKRFKVLDKDGNSCYAYWNVVSSEDMDPTVLMSNGELAFSFYACKEHPISEDKMFLCNNCFTAVIDSRDQDDDE